MPIIQKKTMFQLLGYLINIGQKDHVLARLLSESVSNISNTVTCVILGSIAGLVPVSQK